MLKARDAEEKLSTANKIILTFMMKFPFLVVIFILCTTALFPLSSANTLSINADDQMELYLDAIKIPLEYGPLWNVADRVALTAKTRLIAVYGHNEYGGACMVASDADGFVLSDGQWKYSTTLVPGWETVGFDDRDWKRVTVMAKNGYRWTRVPLVSRFANVIWSPDFKGDQDVYFRYRINYDARRRYFDLIERDKQVSKSTASFDRFSRLQCATECSLLVLTECAGFQYFSANRLCRLLSPALVKGQKIQQLGWNIYSAINVTEPCC